MFGGAYHANDYSEDPTVAICLNCTAETCNGSCARIRAIEAGKPDPGEAYDGIDTRTITNARGSTEKTRKVKELAAKYGRTTLQVYRLLRQGKSFEEIEQGFVAKAAKRMFLEEMAQHGMAKGVVNRLIREGYTWDEIRNEVA